MKGLMDLCSECRYADFSSDYPRVYCEKYIASVNGLTVKDMAILGCTLCELERKSAKEKTKKIFSERKKKSNPKWRY